ncbi:MAG: hypothetical protein ABJC33_12380 [Betaproteobacteria bacterium]
MLGVAASIAIIFMFVHGPMAMFRLSMATAYVGLALLGAVLVIGPLRALRHQPIPLSLDLRRDLGIWAGIVGLAHAAVGLFVHLGNPLLYFLRPPGPPVSWLPRLDVFGAINYAGLAGVLIMALLLATSNDLSVRGLGATRWKSIHRWAYALAALVVGHGAVYQLIEHRVPGFVALFVAIVAVTAVLQWRGFVTRRQGAAPGLRGPGTPAT